MTIYQWITNEFAPAFCNMLLHSLWMGAVAALLAALIIAVTKKTVAATRYNWLGLLFTALVIASVITFLKGLKMSIPAEQSSTALIINPDKTALPSVPAASFPSHNNFVYSVIAFINKNSVVIISIWFLIFSFKIVRMVFGLRYVHNLQHRKVYAVDESWMQWMQQKSRDLGIQKTILFLHSELIKIPVAIGYLKPVILVPLGLLSHLSPQQVESILIHDWPISSEEII